MTILLATNNAHKRREMEGILKQLNSSWVIRQPADLGFSFDTVEDGDTFGANAMQKARALGSLIRGDVLPGVTSDHTGAQVSEMMTKAFPQQLPPILADDSGVCVHALGNRPGVFSARYGNEAGREPLTDSGRNALLLRELTGAADRGAHYVCNAVLWVDSERYTQVQATWHGTITDAPVEGGTGFGYDPLFWMEEFRCTVSQMSQNVKDRVSHRAQAVAALTAAAAVSLD